MKISINHFYRRNYRSLKFLAAALFTPALAMSQSYPTLQTCTFDNSNGGNAASVLVAKNSSGSFALVPSQPTVNIYFGSNASASSSGANEFEVGGIDVTNSTGAELSQAYVTLKGLGFWTQNTPNTTFNYYSWDPSSQSWTGTLGDGTVVTMRVLGGSINGTAVPISDLQLMPATFGATGYNFANIPNTFSASFTDQGTPGGPTTHTASGSVSMPTPLIFMKLGSMAAGTTISNIRVKVGLYYATGDDAWVDYMPDDAPKDDYDYFVQAETELVGTTYDYGDAPASYEIARHAPDVCSPALYIGPNRQDYELSTAGSATADQDDTNEASYNDENASLSTFNTTSTSYTVSLPYVNNTGQPATLSGWIDWNNNGTFESSELASATVPAGSGSATLDWQTAGASATQGTIPGGLTEGSKLVRFRIGSVANEVSAPSGTASNGEVEDMLLEVKNTLPVTLVKFDVTKEGNTVQLHWKTTSETNSDHFVIQVSANAKNWDSVGEVAAHGESVTENLYTFSHQPVNSGANYYRLKMVDRDASFAYSSIKNISINETNEISVYPNPASDYIQLNGIASDHIKEIRVVDMNGKIMLQTLNTNRILDIKGLKTGLYLVQLIGKNGNISARKVAVVR